MHRRRIRGKRGAMLWRFGSWLGLAALLSACRSATPGATAEPDPVATGVEEPATPRGSERHLLAELGASELTHEGLTLDLGSEPAGARRTLGFGAFDPIETVDREGATFLRVTTTRISYDVWLETATDALSVSARIHGGPMRWVTAHLDNVRLGSVRLEPGKTSVVGFPKTRAPVTAGRHSVLLRFWSGKRKPDEPYAEVDWIRVADGFLPTADYPAPTFRDVLTDVVLDGRPRQSLALRPGSAASFPVLVSEGNELLVELGLWGSGTGLAEIYVLEAGRAPVLLHTHKLSGGGGATWSTAKLDLARWSGRLVGLELRAVKATRGGRVAFGEPRLIAPPAQFPKVHARAAVLVVAAGLNRRMLPPWGAAAGMPALAALARSSAIFDQYRTPSSLPAGALASALTGRGPAEHQILDQASRIPEHVPILGEIVRKASGRAAMFTGVPVSFPAFGFDRGWDVYAQFSPVSDISATEPLRRAAEWLEREFKAEPALSRLVVVHTRGAHPPWDLNPQEVEPLKPEDYGGLIDARRGGITLSKLRADVGRLETKDWTRLEELERAALKKQDAALGQLIETLKQAGAWDDTLFIFVGDVSAGEPPHLPFDPAGDLTEDRLRVPLLVKFPNDVMAGQKLGADVTSVDIAATILQALGVEARGDGRSLLESREASLGGRPLVAVLGNRYSTAFGPWLLSGQIGATPKLCRSDVDPACVSDLFSSAALPARAGAFFSRATQARLLKAGRAEREAATIDPATAAALTVWGDLR